MKALATSKPELLSPVTGTGLGMRCELVLRGLAVGNRPVHDSYEWK